MAKMLTANAALAQLQPSHWQPSRWNPRYTFTPSQIVAIARTLLPKEKAAAKERQSHGRTARGRKTSCFGLGDALGIVASCLGVSRTTLQKIMAIIEAAERDPTRFGDLMADLDRYGIVEPIFKKMRRRMLPRRPGATNHSNFDEVKIGRVAVGDINLSELRRIHRIADWILRDVKKSGISGQKVRELIKPNILEQFL